MKDLIDRKTWEAVRHYGGAATEEYYRRLKENRLCATRCDACGHVAFPPRDFCPKCWAKAVSWVDLPKTGTLFAFTTQERVLRFAAPEVIGLVEVEGAGRLFAHIDAPFESLRLGMEMELGFVEISAELTVPKFRPRTS